MEGVLAGNDGLGVDVVAVSGHLQVLMDPVPVLLHNMPVELVDCEASALPPGVGRESPPGSHSRHSQHSEVLVELRFVDLADTVSADGDEVAGDAVGVEEEEGAEGPDAEGAEEGVGLEVALEEVVEVTGEGKSAWGKGYLTPRSRMCVRWSIICLPLQFSIPIFMNFLKAGLSPWFQYLS